MMRYEAKLAGGEGEVFAHLPPDPEQARRPAGGRRRVVLGVPPDHRPESRQARELRRRLQDRRDDARPASATSTVRSRSSKGHTHDHEVVVDVSSRSESKHIRASELCATCHTLLTQALDAQGKVIGELPEQVPYQEWLHSDYQGQRGAASRATCRW